MRKKLSIFLLALFASVGITQAAIVDGSCGDNLTWSLNTKDNTLTITGSGKMTNWSGDPYAPWYDYRSYIKYVSLPDGLTSIGNRAFAGCSRLTSIEIPNSVTSIGEGAFAYCSGLTSVEIPNSVTSIGDYAFAACTGMTEIVVSAENPNYCSADGVLFNKDKTTLIQCPGGKQGEYTIPNSVTSIGRGAFYSCSGLTSVEIPNSVTSIGNYAFSYCSKLTSIEISNSVTSFGEWAFAYCSGLTSITIPNSVTSIGGAAFEGCSGLTSVEIPNSVTSIGSAAFYYCYSLTSITIPNSVTSIGNDAFQYCYSLTSVTNYATTPQAIYGDVFYGVDKSTCTLFVPEESIDLYRAADGWKDFGSIIGVDAPQGVEKVLNDKVSSTKLIRNGNVYILTDDSRTYTLTGQQVK